MATIRRVTIVRGTLSTIILISTLTTVMALENIWGILWLTICLKVSISLV